MAESVVKEQLQSIYDAEGTLTPSLVVNRARSESHPLHRFFEWDDGVAGEKYRLGQAQRMITTVKVTYRSPTEAEKKKVRKWQPYQTPTRDWEYKPVEALVEDDIALKIRLADMKRDWIAFKKRYEDLAEFAAMIREAAAETAA